ncbi:hypothetical protein [Thermococcus thioreducens]|uniref:Uncharacterized protein n=1 Tax=Thermococcus thioreducens TaxID=277988 RepID=A0A0Q2M382_9EURY|nr:hypothetical protein [Thermococcus thioreducens]ASJ12474.1 hypothetical protein A3L14_06025 [Thermococcus thioreducens]KQH82521.1 hypothetical protein AMR53_06220 [Thermococcus thioreducens]SEV90165.1 hypothetical protein SAMN05216170_0750 [Thermococcus thioreducens]
MGWKRFLVLTLVLLFFGMMVSGASATASFVNATVNSTATLPGDPSPEKRPGGEIQPENVGAEIVVEKFFGTFVPGIGWVVFISGVVLAISKYLYSKPVSEFTEAFYKELPDRISYNGQELAKGIENKNRWGTKVEIGYGYVKKKWFGLKKETVIVKSVITITRDEVKAVEDLFSPKEYGKLLAQAYLNGWDANDAKKLAEEFDKQYRGFRAYFNGANLDCGVFEGGDVIIDAKGANHIIVNHIKKKPGKDQFTHISAVDLLNELGKTIENPYKTTCGDIVNGKQRIVLVRYSPKLGKKVVVVIERIKWGMYRIVTAFPPSSGRY